MSTALQVALFIASVAFTLLVVCLIPLAFQARRQLEQLATTAEEVKGEIQILVADGQVLVRNLTELTARANQQLDEVSHVVQTARQWSERADRIVNELGATIEPPVHTLVKNLNLLRAGVTTFLEFFTHRNQHNQTKEEENHV